MKGSQLLLRIVVLTTLGCFSATAKAQTLVSADIASALRATITTNVEPATASYTGNLKAPGQNATDDQIGVWDNGSAAANWWNYTGFTMSNLVDANGNSTGISVATNTGLTASNWNSSAAGAGGDGGLPKNDLLNDGVYSAENASVTTTISGLKVDVPYNLLVYHADDFVSEAVTVNGQAATKYTGPLANPNYADAFDGLLGSDFWYFENVFPNASGQLLINSAGGASIGIGAANTITGFQLVAVPEPAGLLLWLFAGAAALGISVWKRCSRG